MTLEDSQFYLIRPPASRRCRCEFSREGVVVKEEINCPLDAGHQRIGRFFSPLSVVIPCSPPDAILFTSAGQCLIQERAITIMEESQLTGFWTKPAKATQKKTGEPLRVRQLQVLGWGASPPPNLESAKSTTAPGAEPPTGPTSAIQRG